MTPTQRAAALRLIDPENAMDTGEWIGEVDALLRELAAEPVQDMQKALRDAQHTADFYRRRCEALQQWQSRMRDPERTVVCDILANGFTLDPPVPHDRYAMAAEPVPAVTECADDDSPWLVCKPCAAAGKCEKEAEPVQDEPVAWMWQHCETGRTGFVEHHEYNGEWCRDNQRLRIVGPLYAAPQQRKPLTDEQIVEIRRECVLVPSKYESHYGWAIHFARAIEKAITGEQK